MSKTFLLLLLLILFANCLAKAQLTDSEKGQAAAMLFNTFSNSIKEMKIGRLNKQKYSINKLDDALAALEKDNLKNAYESAEEAMVSFPKFSLSYLIMSYAALQSNDYLNSNRLINLYERYSRKRYNEKLNIDVPKEFIALVKERSSKGFNNLDQKSISEKFRKEPWLNSSMDIQILPAAVAMEDLGFGYVPSDFPGGISENNISLTYKKYFWLNRKNALPYSNNNYAITFFSGANVNVNFPNTYFPLNYKLFITPGFFIKKLYITPGRLQYNIIPSYSNPYDDYKRINNSSLRFLISPEVRWFPGVLNAYATDMKKLTPEMKKNAKFEFSYVSFKMFLDQLSGSDPVKGSYNLNRNELLIGFGAYIGRNRTTEFACYLGPGTFSRFDISHDGRNYFTSPSYFKFGLTISKRIL